MNLTTRPDFIELPPVRTVFVEKIGPFSETARKAWQALHAHMAELSKDLKTTGFRAFYQTSPQMIYRAGAVVDRRPSSPLPDGLAEEEFVGGRYARFILKGSYAQLPEACGQIFKIVKETSLPVRQAFFIENYVNDPKTTPESELVTEILVPVV